MNAERPTQVDFIGTTTMATPLEVIEMRMVSICRELIPAHRAAFGAYYLRMLENNRILTDADRAIVKYLCGKFERPTHSVLEICAGIGQLTLTLASLGFVARAIDKDIPRCELSRKIATEMDFSRMTLTADWRQCRFALEHSYILICTNSVNSNTASNDVELLKQHLDRGGHLIWQPGMFGVENPEAGPLENYQAVDVGQGVWHQWK